LIIEKSKSNLVNFNRVSEEKTSSSPKTKSPQENNYLATTQNQTTYNHKATHSVDSSNNYNKTSTLPKTKIKETVYETLNTEFVNDFHSKIKDSDKRNDVKESSPLKTETNVNNESTKNRDYNYIPINTEPSKNAKVENAQMLKLNITNEKSGTTYGNYANFNIKKKLKEQYEKFIKKNTKTPSIDISKEPVIEKKEKEKEQEKEKIYKQFINTSMSFDQNADPKNLTFENVPGSSINKTEIKKKL